MYSLQKVMRTAPDAAGSARMQAGTKAHERHGRIVQTQSRVKHAAQYVLGITAVVTVLLWCAYKIFGAGS